MVEPVRLLALRVHDGRARSVQRPDAVAKGDINIPLGLRDADVIMSALRRLYVTGHVF